MREDAMLNRYRLAQFAFIACGIGCVVSLHPGCGKPMQASGADRSSDALLPFRVDGFWGYRKPDGTVVIRPRYSEASRFRKVRRDRKLFRYAWVQTEGRQQIIDVKANVVFSGQMLWVHEPGIIAEVSGRDSVTVHNLMTGKSFEVPDIGVSGLEWRHEGKGPELISIMGPNGLYGFMDHDGNMKIKPQFERSCAFMEGLAAVRDASGLWGFIDTEGNWVIKPDYNFVMLGFTQSGLSGVVRKGGHFVYIDRRGQVAIETGGDVGTTFVHGLASVRVDGTLRVIDREGNQVFPDAESSYIPQEDLPSDPLVPVSITTEKGVRKGYTDSTGELKIDFGIMKDPIEISLGRFADGFARIERRSRKGTITLLGYIDTQGAWVYKVETQGEESEDESKTIEETIGG
jgi:hypothetical protein